MLFQREVKIPRNKIPLDKGSCEKIMSDRADCGKSPLTPLCQRGELAVERPGFSKCLQEQTSIFFVDYSPFEKGGNEVGFDPDLSGAVVGTFSTNFKYTALVACMKFRWRNQLNLG